MNFSIRDLKGIGPRKEALFARLHLATVSDLLQYFPRDYEDRSHMLGPSARPRAGRGSPWSSAGPSRQSRKCGPAGACHC